MTNNKVDQENLEKTIILFLLIRFDVQVLVLFELTNVNIEFYQGYNQNNCSYVKAWWIFNAYIDKKPYDTDKIDKKSIVKVILSNLS